MSNIDPTKPTAGQATTQSVRDNFQAAADEIDANAAAVAANDVGIANNTANISTNAAGISQNITDIATNAGNIATNAANIATNTSDISALQAGGGAYAAYGEIGVNGSTVTKDNGFFTSALAGLGIHQAAWITPQPDANYNIQVTAVEEFAGVTSTVFNVTTTGFSIAHWDAAGVAVNAISSLVCIRTDQPFV